MSKVMVIVSICLMLSIHTHLCAAAPRNFMKLSSRVVGPTANALGKNSSLFPLQNNVPEAAKIPTKQYGSFVQQTGSTNKVPEIIHQAKSFKSGPTGSSGVIPTPLLVYKTLSYLNDSPQTLTTHKANHDIKLSFNDTVPVSQVSNAQAVHDQVARPSIFANVLLNSVPHSQNYQVSPDVYLGKSVLQNQGNKVSTSTADRLLPREKNSETQSTPVTSDLIVSVEQKQGKQDNILQQQGSGPRSFDDVVQTAKASELLFEQLDDKQQSASFAHDQNLENNRVTHHDVSSSEIVLQNPTAMRNKEKAFQSVGRQSQAAKKSSQVRYEDALQGGLDLLYANSLSSKKNQQLPDYNAVLHDNSLDLLFDGSGVHQNFVYQSLDNKGVKNGIDLHSSREPIPVDQGVNDVQKLHDPLELQLKQHEYQLDVAKLRNIQHADNNLQINTQKKIDINGKQQPMQVYADPDYKYALQDGLSLLYDEPRELKNKSLTDSDEVLVSSDKKHEDLDPETLMVAPAQHAGDKIIQEQSMQTNQLVGPIESLGIVSQGSSSARLSFSVLPVFPNSIIQQVKQAVDNVADKKFIMFSQSSLVKLLQEIKDILTTYISSIRQNLSMEEEKKVNKAVNEVLHELENTVVFSHKIFTQDSLKAEVIRVMLKKFENIKTK